VENAITLTSEQLAYPSYRGIGPQLAAVREVMKRIRIVGLGAVAGSIGTAAAFFLHPRAGSGRRAAVRRGGEAVVRQSANVATLMGSTSQRDRHRRSGAAANRALRDEVATALAEAIDTDEFPLSVVVKGGSVTIRGEVEHLAQIATVRHVLDGFAEIAETVNLVRVRPRIDPTAAV
jgi:osmotically-inducible protein OsmY